MVEIKKVSPQFSFDGWNIWEFVRGRKRTAITVISAGLAYVITDSELISILSGVIAESIWAIIEYWYKKTHYTVAEINV